MDKYFIFLKALQEAEFCNSRDWNLFELKDWYELDDIDYLVRQDFTGTKRLDGFLDPGVYVVIEQGCWLHQYLSENTQLIPKAVYTKYDKKVLLFYCLEEYDCLG